MRFGSRCHDSYCYAYLVFVFSQSHQGIPHPCMSRAQPTKLHLDLEGVDGAESPTPTPGRRVRRPQRPRVMPLDMREKLVLLGHPPASNGTSRENLGELNARLSADLKHYRALADRWQKKYVDLERSRGDLKASAKPTEAPRSRRVKSDPELAPSTLLPALQHTNPALSAFASEVSGRVETLLHPSLSLVKLEAPKIQSNVRRLVNDSTFDAAMQAIEIMTSLHKSSTTHEACRTSGALVKPDFDTQKAFRVWNDVFEPMSFHYAAVQLNASSSSRQESLIDIDDPDTDHFDKAMARATDLELVDMLHYVAILIGGMHQLVFDDPSLAPARTHLGRSCERLIREVVFTRNLFANPHLARCLLDGLVGSICHFSTHEMAAAVTSLLNMSWMLFMLHSGKFNPTTRIFLSFYSLLTSRTESQRTAWMKRLEEGVDQCPPVKPFPALMMNSFGAAYNALRANDEGTVLHHISLLEEFLAPALSPSEIGEFLQRFQPVYPEEPASEWQYAKELPFALSSYYEPELDGQSHSTTEGHEIIDWLFSSLPSTEFDLATIAPYAQISTIDINAIYTDAQGKAISPGENLKSLYRIPLLLLRADASLAVQDYENCMYWVDEAEKTMLSIPLDYMFQRVFLMKNVIKTTCPFPNGPRSVVDEFEQRMLAYDIARCAVPSTDRVAIGALWRTP